MDTIENFDFNELKISSDEIKEYDTGKPHPSYKPSTNKKQREFSLEYKGGKPKFRAIVPFDLSTYLSRRGGR